MKTLRNRKSGFTLVEMLVVVTLIAIVATIGISLLGGASKDAAESVNIANIRQLTNNLGAYQQLHGGLLPDKLDSLMSSNSVTRGLTYTTVTTGVAIADSPALAFYIGLDTDNDGVMDNSTGTSKGIDPAAWRDSFRTLTAYQLTGSDITNLASIGITTVYDVKPALNLFHGDIEYTARTLKAGDPVAIVDPYTTGGGRHIYHDFGISDAEETSIYPSTAAGRNALFAKQRYLVFGVGPNTTMLGDRKAGIQDAPKSSVPKPGYYNRYLLVVKMPMGANDQTIDMAGVLDPQGKNSRKAYEWATRTAN